MLLTYSKTYCSGVTVASPRCFGSHSLLLRYLRVRVCVRGCVQQQGKIKDKKRKNEEKQTNARASSNQAKKKIQVDFEHSGKFSMLTV